MKQLERGKKKSKKRRIWYVLIIAVVLAYSSLAFLVTPTFKPISQEIGIEHRPADITWPTVGSASIGELHSKRVFSSLGGDVSVPSASTIKLLTALVVLEQKPLGPTEQGEAIYFGSEDTQRYNQIVANGGAALLIPENTTISYREALDALLVDSANNIADKLAIWAFGSVDNYIGAAKVLIAKESLTGTTLADASGLMAGTKSTPNDMFRIAQLAMSSPVIASIVRQEEATLRDGRVLHNTNTLLEVDGIVGLKTGNTVEAGFCLVAAKQVTIKGQDKLLLSVIFGQESRRAAEAATTSLFMQTESGYEESNLATRNVPVAYLEAPWGERVSVLPRRDITILRWKGESLSGRISLLDRTHGKTGEVVGSVDIGGQSFDLILGADLPGPSIWWRIEHAVDFIREKL